MKIAIASDDKVCISDHFGRAQGFSIFEIDKDKIISQEYRVNAGKSDGNCGSCNHAMMIDNIRDCEIVISYGMGRRIYDDLATTGIKAIITEEKAVKDAIEKFMSDNLKNRLDRLHTHKH